MPQPGWSAKRERQYEHIKDSALERGESRDTAEEIAARTVKKGRARAGEAKEASGTSTEDISSGRRGGLRSHTGARGRTRDQLYQDAKRHNIRGRSTMTKAELEEALKTENCHSRVMPDVEMLSIGEAHSMGTQASDMCVSPAPTRCCGLPTRVPPR